MQEQIVLPPTPRRLYGWELSDSIRAKQGRSKAHHQGAGLAQVDQPAAWSGVRSANSRADFDACLEDAGTRLVCVQFTAKWCAPCRAFEPQFVMMANDRTRVAFVKIDVDINEVRSRAADGAEAVRDRASDRESESETLSEGARKGGGGGGKFIQS